MDKEELIIRLQAKYLVNNNVDLLRRLQLEYGLVSDEAITIDDCADRDLIRAYQWDLWKK